MDKTLESSLHPSSSPLEQNLFEAVARQLHVGVLVIEASSGRTLFANEKLKSIWGVDEIPRSAKERADLFQVHRLDGTPLASDEWPSMRAIRYGVRSQDVEIRIVLGNGTPGYVRVSADPVRDARGSVTAAVVTVQDVTEIRRQELAFRFLDEAGNLLSSSLDLQTVLQQLAQLAVSRFRGWCAISLLNDAGALEESALHCHDPEKVSNVVELRRLYPADPRLDRRYQVLRTGQSWFIPDVTEEVILAHSRDPHHAELIRRLGLRGLIQSPLVYRGRTLGLVAFASTDHAYDSFDLQIAEKLAERAAAAIENARLYQQISVDRETLFRKESQLRLITDAVPVLISYIDPTYRYRFVNATYEQWFKLERESLIGQSMIKVVGEQSFHEKVKPVLDRALSGEAATLEVELNYPRAGIRHVFCHYIPHRNTMGDVLGVIGLVTDMTEKRKSGELLRNAQDEVTRIAKQLALVTDTIPDFIAYIGLDERFRFVNSAVETWFGRSRSEILARELREIVGEEVYEAGREARDRALRSAESVRFETTLRKPSGASTDFEVEYLPDQGPSGAVRGFVMVAHDISLQKNYERTLRESIQSRDDFLSIASHELKTPVTSLKLQLQIVQRNMKLGQALAPARLERMLDVSIRQVNRLSTLIEDLLDVSRIGAGKMSYHFEEVDFGAVTLEVLERFADQFAAAHSVLKTEVAEGILIRCDRFRIEQVITNLLTNAIKYGGGKSISVLLSREAGGAMFRVTDHGIGIAREKRDRIFGRFERAVSHKNISGLGLGLYITKQIVVSHGGTIDFESELGRGSTFTVFLPACPATEC